MTGPRDTLPPLDLRVLEAELRRVTGSSAADAVTRSTAGIQLLNYCRALREALIQTNSVACWVRDCVPKRGNMNAPEIRCCLFADVAAITERAAAVLAAARDGPA